jgi:uncharacterized protein (TIGR03083 family)
VLSADNLASIESDGRELGRIAAASPDLPVPQYPGWTLDDLLYHTAGVHGRTMLVCRERAEERVQSPRCPEGMSVLAWYQQTLEGLLAVFRDSDPTIRVWGFGSQPTIGFWERRMVIETGVHRRDASQAVGDESPISDLVATSGLDEFGEMWLPYLGEVSPLTVVAVDLARAWEFGGAEGPTLEGTGSDIYLRLMSRPTSVELPSDWAKAVDGMAPPPKPDRAPRPT